MLSVDASMGEMQQATPLKCTVDALLEAKYRGRRTEKKAEQFGPQEGKG